MHDQYATCSLGLGIAQEGLELESGFIDGMAVQVQPRFPGDPAALELAAGAIGRSGSAKSR